MQIRQVSVQTLIFLWKFDIEFSFSMLILSKKTRYWVFILHAEFLQEISILNHSFRSWIFSWKISKLNFFTKIDTAFSFSKIKISMKLTFNSQNLNFSWEFNIRFSFLKLNFFLKIRHYFVKQMFLRLFDPFDNFFRTFLSLNFQFIMWNPPFRCIYTICSAVWIASSELEKD